MGRARNEFDVYREAIAPLIFNSKKLPVDVEEKQADVAALFKYGVGSEGFEPPID